MFLQTGLDSYFAAAPAGQISSSLHRTIQPKAQSPRLTMATPPGLLRRDLPRRGRRIGQVLCQLGVAKFRVLHGFFLDRPEATDAIR